MPASLAASLPAVGCPQSPPAPSLMLCHGHCPVQCCPTFGVRCPPGPTLTSYHTLRLQILSFRYIFNFNSQKLLTRSLL